MQSYQTQMISARQQQQNYYNQPKKTTNTTPKPASPVQPPQIQQQVQQSANLASAVPPVQSTLPKPSGMAKPLPNFKQFQERRQQTLQQQNQQQQQQHPEPDEEQLPQQPQHEYFPEEEYAQNLPADDDVTDFYPNQKPKFPNNNANINTNESSTAFIQNHAPADSNLADQEMYEFQDGENLSQPHPDEVSQF